MALIKTSHSVPSVYISQSRDFQTIGHLYEAVFNSSKLATDMVDKMVPGSDFDERLLNLSTTTRGFIKKHEYSANDLSMILSSFATLLKLKGTKKAIDSAINILLRSQGISDDYIWIKENNKEIDPQKKYFNLGLSDRVTDRVLLYDLFDYILPFGFIYRITNYKTTPLGENISNIGMRDVSSNVVINAKNDFENSAIVSNRKTTATILLKTEDNVPDTVVAKPVEDLSSDEPGWPEEE